VRFTKSAFDDFLKNDLLDSAVLCAAGLIGEFFGTYNALCVRMHNETRMVQPLPSGKAITLASTPSPDNLAGNEEARYRMAIAFVFNTAKVGPIGAEACLHLAMLSMLAQRELANQIADKFAETGEGVGEFVQGVADGAGDLVEDAWKAASRIFSLDARSAPARLMGWQRDADSHLSSIPHPLEPATATSTEVIAGACIVAAIGAAPAILGLLIAGLLAILRATGVLSAEDFSSATSLLGSWAGQQQAAPAYGYVPGNVDGESLQELRLLTMGQDLPASDLQQRIQDSGPSDGANLAALAGAGALVLLK
jgi:hypothetical protein